MLIYSVIANQNAASESDGYVMGLRVAESPLLLFSFHFLEGRETFPIHNWRGGKRVPITDEDLRSRKHEPVVDERRLRSEPAGGGAP